jgi:hypothetical protein
MDNNLENVETNKTEINMLRTIMEQIYFPFDQQYYRQTEWLSMGAPTSAILAEAYLQYVEHKQLYSILMKCQIIGYCRYVDDILMIYNQKKTNTDESSAEYNKQRTNTKFIIEKEQHESIYFLDRTIYRKRTELEFAIYRKYTQIF